MRDVKQQNRRSVVWMFMVRHASQQANAQQSLSGYRVELPRPHDVIGVVLRDTYLRDIELPDDMNLLLRRMNGNHCP